MYSRSTCRFLSVELAFSPGLRVYARHVHNSQSCCVTKVLLQICLRPAPLGVIKMLVEDVKLCRARLILSGWVLSGSHVAEADEAGI